MNVYALRVIDPDNGWEKSVTLLLVVAVTAAFQLLGHCCCAGKRQSVLPAGGACGSIPLSEVGSSGSMQNQRWGDVVGGNRSGDATAAAASGAPGSIVLAAKVAPQQHEQAAQQLDDSNFGIAQNDDDEYEEF